jgi:myo-inositol 2-dehydrogenase / D-chiro-inositol 1-dehydrogenase
MTAKTRTIRFGVIGCGVIAFWTHLRELGRLKNARLVAAADPDVRARERAARLTGVPVYEHAEKVLERSDIDALVICAPTHLHAELAVAAATAHKHFYLEKPIASTALDGRRVVQAADDTGVSAAVGFNRRFHPAFEEARALLTAGSIGRVRAVLTAFCEPAAPGGMPEWKRQRRTGGGVLLDLASHHVDLVRWFLNCEPTEIEARLTSEVSEDDSAWLRLTMTGGSEVSSFFSFRAGFADYLEFIGERGTLRVDRHRRSLSLRLPRRFGYGTRRVVVFPSRDAFLWRMIRLVRPSYDPSYRRALAAFVEMLNGGPPRVPTLSDGLQSLETVVAAEESARTGRSMKMISDRS